MPIVTKISDGGKMNISAQMRRQVGLEQGGPVMVSVVDGEIRIRALRQVLTNLQDQAQSVFAGSGETVAGFLAERRAEAAHEGDIPA
jgi:bifunctional DNA-binding transcriptional regulator/antitoxin component of YhaV-PrlF toxin-antitoxin module